MVPSGSEPDPEKIWTGRCDGRISAGLVICLWEAGRLALVLVGRIGATEGTSRRIQDKKHVVARRAMLPLGGAVTSKRHSRREVHGTNAASMSNACVGARAHDTTEEIFAASGVAPGTHGRTNAR